MKLKPRTISERTGPSTPTVRNFTQIARFLFSITLRQVYDKIIAVVLTKKIVHML